MGQDDEELPAVSAHYFIFYPIMSDDGDTVKPDLLLVSESDHFLPTTESSTDPYTFGPMNDYFVEPLGLLGLPYHYRLPNPPPLGIISIGTALRRRGFAVRAFANVFRVPAEREAFFRDLDAGPAAVGISTGCLLDPGSVARIAGWVRERSPGSKVILGGFNAERSKAMRALGDMTVFGPGEETLAEVMTALRKGRGLEDIPNVEIAGKGTPRAVAGKPLSEDIPAPDWDLLELRPSRCYSIEASRGCRHACAFCSYSGKGYQTLRPAASVAEEIRRDWEEYGIRLLRFVDANLTSYPDWTEELCALLERARLPVRWACFARADDLAARPALASRMRDAGCLGVYCGVESASDELLRRMRKGSSVDQAGRGIRAARDAGLHVHANFIVGFPGEDRGTLDSLLGFIRSSGLDTVSFSVLAMTRELEEFAREHPDAALGLRRKGPVWEHSTMGHAEAAEHAGKLIDAVAVGMERPLVAPFGVLLFYLLGNGSTMEQSLDYLSAFRDRRRASRAGDAAQEERALERIRVHYLRMRADMQSRLPAGAAPR